MSQVYTQPPSIGDLIKREFDKDYSREIVTLKAGNTYEFGSVLGKVTATGLHSLAPAASTEGFEGAEIGCAVLIETVDATSADVQAVAVVRGPAIVADVALVFDATVDSAEERNTKLQQLAAHGIVAR